MLAKGWTGGELGYYRQTDRHELTKANVIRHAILDRARSGL